MVKLVRCGEDFFFPKYVTNDTKQLNKTEIDVHKSHMKMLRIITEVFAKKKIFKKYSLLFFLLKVLLTLYKKYRVESLICHLSLVILNFK